jgi:hypothetical protein
MKDITDKQQAMSQEYDSMFAVMQEQVFPQDEKKPMPFGRLCIVRIGTSSKTALSDYAKMKETPNNRGLFMWDKDHANKIRVGDVLGFILGSGAETYMEYYHIIEEGTNRERDESWKVSQPYQAGNGESSVSHRQVIRMKEMKNPQIRLWSELKTQLGYSQGCASWMPRGTMVVSNTRISDVHTLFQ